ncbi:MAG TPA: protease modulator HflC [Chthoniobacterales bacterium]|jgi:membrane protease subunit HflC
MNATLTASARWLAFGLGAVLVLLVAASHIVRENEKVVVLRFGKPIHVLTESGWYARLPWPVDRVETFDGRLQQAEIRLSETLTRDKRNVIVPMFFAWRIAEPVRFLASVGNISSATQKLDAIVTSARNAALGQRSFDDLASLKAGRQTLVDLETAIAADARDDAAENLGIELVSVGISQIKLPQANTESVFRRMRAERKREASQYRAEGRSQAETIRAETDKNTAVLLAEAKRYAEETRGKAEADAAQTYAAAHGRDVQFYHFLRELQSLRSVVDRNTTLVFDTSIPPFNLLKNGPASPAAPAGPGPALPGENPVVLGSWLTDPARTQ